jgi:hypothetical protein
VLNPSRKPSPKMRLTLALMTLLASCSLFSGCGIARPNAYVYGVNVPGLSTRGYNLKSDYNDQMELKKSAKPRVVEYKNEAEMLIGLNKQICTDPDSFAAIKAYIKKVRKAYDAALSGQNCFQ